MRRLARIAVVALGIAFPLLAHALPPPGVTGLSAEYADGQVHIHWNPTESDDVSFYRVYYARRSILESGGQYDDFETVDGKLTNYILKSPPRGDTFFVAVLAVNSQLEESDYFAEEVKVDLAAGDAVGTTDPSQAPTVSPFRREREASTIGLVSADQISSTEVLLKFSHNVIVDPARAANAFHITDAAGRELPLRRLVIQSSTVRVTTDAQVRGQNYNVSVSAVVQGESPAGAALPLDDTRSTGQFAASMGIDAPVASASSAAAAVSSAPSENEAVSSATSSASVDSDASSSAAETSSSSAQASSSATATIDSLPANSFISRLTLSVEPDREKLWRVTVDWTGVLPPEQFSGYLVRAERENREITLPSGEHTMVFAGVKPGTFVASVRVMQADGTSAEAATRSIVISQNGAVYRGPISKNLTDSGAGIALVVGASGGTAAWLKRRRSARAQNVTQA